MFNTIKEGIQSIRQQCLQTDTSVYVPTRGIKSPQQPEISVDLHTTMASFCKENPKGTDKKIFLLLGDGGAGKSTFILEFYKTCWQHYQQQQPIPLWIPLPDIEQPYERAVAKSLSMLGFTDEQVTELKENYTFTIFVDGIDELHNMQNFYVTNRLDEWRAKLVVSCRSQVYYRMQQPEKMFSPYVSGIYKSNLTEVYHVAPFNEEQIKICIQEYKPDDNNLPSVSYDALLSIPGLSDFINNPFFLYCALEALPIIQNKLATIPPIEQANVTLAELFDVFVTHYFARQELKLKEQKLIPDNQDLKPQFWHFCQRLALEMNKHNVCYVNPRLGGSSLFKKETDNIWGTFFSSQYDIVRSACPLRTVGNNVYAFRHSLFIQYFVTKAIYEAEIKNESGLNQLATDKASPTSSQSEVSISTATPQQSVADTHLSSTFNNRLFTNEQEYIQLMADRLIIDPRYKALMWHFVLASKTDDRYAIAAANALTVLNRAQVALSGQDLSHIKVPGVVLNHPLCEYTDFNHADLSNSQFIQPYLVDAQFEETCFNNINLGQQPYIKFKKPIQRMITTHDGRLIAVACDKEVMIYDRQLNDVIARFHKHTQPIATLDFSEDGKYLLSAVGLVYGCTKHDPIHIWDVEQKKLARTIVFGENYPLRNVKFILGSTMLAASQSTYTIELYDLANSQWLTPLIAEDEEAPFGVIYGIWHYATYLPLNLLACSYGTGKLLIWDLAKKALVTKLFRVLDNAASAMSFTPDGTQVALCGILNDTRMIRFWHVAQQEFTYTFPLLNETVSSLQFSRDGRFFATGSREKTVCLWNYEKREIVGAPLVGHTEAVSSVIFNTESTHLYSASRDGTIKQWDLQAIETNPSMTTNMKPFDTIQSLALSADDRFLVSVGGRDMQWWDFQTLQKRRTTHLPISILFSHASFSPDGKYLAYAGKGNRVREIDRDDIAVDMLDVKTGQSIRSSLFIRHNYKINDLQFSHDGQYLGICYNDTLNVFNVNAFKAYKEVQLDRDSFNYGKQTVISRNGLTIAHLNQFNSIVILLQENDSLTWKYDVEAKQDITLISLSDDGTMLAAATKQHSILLWHLSETQEFNSPPLHLKLKYHEKDIQNIIFSHDNKQIVSGSAGFVLCIWSAIDGTLTKVLNDTSSITSFTHQSTHLIGRGHYKLQRFNLLTGAIDDLSSNITRDSSGIFYLKRITASPCGRWVAIYCSDNYIEIWKSDFSEKKGRVEYRKFDMTRLVFSHDGQWLATCSQYEASLWNVEQLKLVTTVKRDFSTAYSTGFSQDNTKWYIVGGRFISIDIQSCVALYTDSLFPNADKPWGLTYTNLRFAANAPRLAYSWYEKETDSRTIHGITLYDIENNRVLTTYKSKKAMFGSIELSTDGTRLISTDTKHTIFLWSCQNKFTLQTKFEDRKTTITHIAFSPDQQWFVSSARDQTLKVWSTSSKHCVKAYNQVSKANCLLFSHNGKHLVVANDHAIAVRTQYPITPSRHSPYLLTGYVGVPSLTASGARLHNTIGLTDSQRRLFLLVGANVTQSKQKKILDLTKNPTNLSAQAEMSDETKSYTST